MNEKVIIGDGSHIYIRSLDKRVPVNEITEEMISLWEKEIDNINHKFDLKDKKLELYFSEKHKYHYVVSANYYENDCCIGEIRDYLSDTYNGYMYSEESNFIFE